MAFRGEVRTVTALLDAADASAGYAPTRRFGVLHTVTDNARTCLKMLASGEGLDACWRFGILQTLDDYTSTLRRGGPELASGVFDSEPPRTGAVELDAAFAALAEYLADRDGWTTPSWALSSRRRTEAWYPSVPAILRDEAERQSPEAFRSRGIFITSYSLERA